VIHDNFFLTGIYIAVTLTQSIMSTPATLPKKTSSKVTIRDVAHRAGVTLTTVSSAMNGRGRVSEETRDKIKKIADEMGYQPRLAAQMMRASSTGHIGLILPGTDPQMISESGHPGPILANFIGLCEQRDITYHIEHWDASGRGGFKPPRQLTNGLSDGVIVGGYIGDQLREWLDERKVSWVSIGEPSDHCVLSADDEGLYQATQRLAALGHRRIAYLGGPQKYLTHRMGVEGFRRAEKEFGLSAGHSDWTMLFDTNKRSELIAQARQWTRRVLAGKTRPSAIICHDTVIARAVIYEAMLMGLSVPADFSLIGVGMAGDAEKAPPALSAVEVDFYTLVEQAMDMLFHLLDGRFSMPALRRVPPRLVMRDTVVPPT
jgi:LacI family transcriptional regulator